MLVDSHGKTIIKLLRNCHSSFQSGSIILQWIRVPIAVPPYKQLELSVLGGFDYSNRCAIVPHCCFNLQFSNDKWCLATFHTFIWHLYSFFLVKYLFRSYFPFLSRLFVFLSLRCKSIFVCLDASVLKIFSANLWLIISFS